MTTKTYELNGKWYTETKDGEHLVLTTGDTLVAYVKNGERRHLDETPRHMLPAKPNSK